MKSFNQYIKHVQNYLTLMINEILLKSSAEDTDIRTCVKFVWSAHGLALIIPILKYGGP